MTRHRVSSILSRFAACLAAASAPLPAQGVARFLPANPIATMRVLGPRALGERLADTNIGRLLADPAAAPIRELTAKFLDEATDAIGDERLESHIRHVCEGLGHYGGRIEIGVHVTIDPNAEYGIGGCLVGMVLAPDGTTDFSQVVELVDDAATEAELPRHSVGTAENGFTILRAEGRKELTLPRVIDGYLVVYFGIALETELSRVGEAPSRAPDDDQGDDALMRFGIDLQQFWPLLGFDAGGSRPDSLDPATRSKLMARLGMDRFEGSVRVEGAFTRWDYALSVMGSPSILDVLAPNEKATPIAALVDPGRGNWTSVRIDVDALLQLVRDLVQDTQGTDVLEQMGQLSSALGLDLQKDLLGAFDGQALILHDILAAGTTTPRPIELDDDDDDDESALDGFLSGILGLRDAKSFEATFEKLLRSRGLHAARKTVDYRGVQVRTLNVAFLQFSYAVLNEGIAFGVGSIGAESVRSLIDGSFAVADGRREIRFSEAFAERRACLGEGWRDFQLASSAGHADFVRQVVVEEFASTRNAEHEDFVREVAIPALDAWLELAPRFDLERSLSAMRLVNGRLEMTTIQ